MSLPYSGKTGSFHHKWNDTPNPADTDPGFSRMWVLNAQWTDCPIEVYEQVKDLWTLRELGNDKYVYKASIEHLQELVDENVTIRKLVDVDGKREWQEVPLKTDYVIQYAKEHGIADDEKFFIHFWW